MIKCTAIFALLATVLFIAPVIESMPWTDLFQAVGNAAEGAGD